MKTQKTWTNYLSKEIYIRLAQCQTTKGDLPILLDAKWQWAQDTGHYNSCTKESMLVDILELLDCNGLEDVSELTFEEWQDLIK